MEQNSCRPVCRTEMLEIAHQTTKTWPKLCHAVGTHARAEARFTTRAATALPNLLERCPRTKALDCTFITANA